MVTIVISIAAFVVAALTLVLTVRREVNAIRPILVFTYRNDGWYVENVGNGPAMDLVFHRLRNGTVTQNVRLPTLATGSQFCLHFARHDSEQIFLATYRDTRGNDIVLGLRAIFLRQPKDSKFNVPRTPVAQEMVGTSGQR